MHLRTIETSAADVAAALELIMPFGHGSRIPQQYIDDKTSEMELRDQPTSDAEPELREADNDQLPKEEISLVVEENPTIDVIEDTPLDDETHSSVSPTETKQDLIDQEESPSSVVSSDKPSLTTEDTSSIESSDEPALNSTEIADLDDHHSDAESETRSEVEEDHVSIAESFDFTISVSISEDEDDNSVGESVSIEVIAKAHITEEGESGNADDKNAEEKDAKSLVVNGSMTSSPGGKSTASPSPVKSHIIDIAVEDGEEEYFQSTTSRDSFLIKLSLLGALSDVIYDDFVEQVCEHKALVMTIVKRYDVCLLREIEKPQRKSRLKEHKTTEPETPKHENKISKGPCPETKIVPLQQRKQVLHLEPLELPDFSYVEELVKQTKSQIRKRTQSAKEAIAQEATVPEEKNQTTFQIRESTPAKEAIVQVTTVQEDKNEETIDELLYVEELMKQSESQIKESAETTQEETVQVLENEEIFEYGEPIEPELGKGSFDILLDEALEEREDVESRDVDEVIDLVEPAMLQGSGQQLHVPKFRAVIEIVEEDEASTPEEPSSVELSRQEEVQEIDEVREPAEESAPKRSAFTIPKRKTTSRSSTRNPFAPTTSMAAIRAEVEEKYSKMARPTAAFDRETLYPKATTNSANSKYAALARKKPIGFMAAYRAVTVTAAYKAPEVRVATAYAGGRTEERAMPEVIDLVDVVDLVDVDLPEPMVMAE